MPVDHIRYDLLTQQALRSVLRRVLSDAAKTGLPGEHHFYITFDTQVAGVRLSARLREEYPEAMTIVLQHQFYDLTVSETIFEVGLSFGGVMERLTVPFDAVTGFFDPSVQFGLQFATEEGEEGEATETPGVVREAPKPRAATPVPAEPAEKAEPAAPAAVAPVKDPPDKPAGGAEVVRLDRFRKK